MSAETTLRRAAIGLRSAKDYGECRCGPGGDTWFDRSICPEPCGSMHTRCGACGGTLGVCWWDEEQARPSDYDLAVARMLSQAADALEHPDLCMDCFHPTCLTVAEAITVARAYLGEDS